MIFGLSHQEKKDRCQKRLRWIDENRQRVFAVVPLRLSNGRWVWWQWVWLQWTVGVYSRSINRRREILEYYRIWEWPSVHLFASDSRRSTRL